MNVHYILVFVRTELEVTKKVPFFGEPAIIVNIDTEDTCTHEVR